MVLGLLGAGRGVCGCSVGALPPSLYWDFGALIFNHKKHKRESTFSFRALCSESVTSGTRLCAPAPLRENLDGVGSATDCLAQRR